MAPMMKPKPITESAWFKSAIQTPQMGPQYGTANIGQQLNPTMAELFKPFNNPAATATPSAFGMGSTPTEGIAAGGLGSMSPGMTAPATPRGATPNLVGEQTPGAVGSMAPTIADTKVLNETAPESSWGSNAWDYMTGGSGAQHKIGDIVNGKALSSLDVQNMEEARLAGARADDLNSFDWTGGLNTALAGWQALETNKNNKEMMSLYKGQLADARAETSRRNKTRSAWGTAMANAGTKTA